MTPRTLQINRHDPDPAKPPPVLTWVRDRTEGMAQFVEPCHVARPCLANGAPPPERKRLQYSGSAIGKIKESLSRRGV